MPKTKQSIPTRRYSDWTWFPVSPVFLKLKPLFSTTLVTVSYTPVGTGSGRTSLQDSPVPWLEAALLKVRAANSPSPPGALNRTSIQRTASWDNDLLSKSMFLQNLKKSFNTSCFISSTSASEWPSSLDGPCPWVSVDQERAKVLSLPCSSPLLLLLLLLHDGLLIFAWHWWSLPDTPLRGFASWPFFSCVSSSGHVGVEAHSPGIGAVPPFLLPLLLVGWRHGPRLVPAALSLAALGSRRATSS